MASTVGEMAVKLFFLIKALMSRAAAAILSQLKTQGTSRTIKVYAECLCPDRACEKAKNAVSFVRITSEQTDKLIDSGCVCNPAVILHVTGLIKQTTRCALFSEPKIVAWSHRAWRRFSGFDASHCAPVSYISQGQVPSDRDGCDLVCFEQLLRDTRPRVMLWLLMNRHNRVPHIGQFPRGVVRLILDWIINTDACFLDWFNDWWPSTPNALRIHNRGHITHAELPMDASVDWELQVGNCHFHHKQSPYTRRDETRVSMFDVFVHEYITGIGDGDVTEWDR